MKSSRMRAKTDNAKTATKLLVAMTGKASSAKAAEGDEPVFAYIASLPQPQRGVAERIDALAAKTLPDLLRAVKWGMAYYGVGGGWCFSSGAFAGVHPAARSSGRRGSNPETAWHMSKAGNSHLRAAAYRMAVVGVGHNPGDPGRTTPGSASPGRRR